MGRRILLGIGTNYCLLTVLTAGGIFGSGCAAPGSQVKDVLINDLSQRPGALWQDGKQLVAQPENIAIILIGGGASGYVRCAYDDEIEEHFRDHHTFGRDLTIAIGTCGNPLTHTALAWGGYMYGILTDHEQTRQVSGSLIEALTLNTILTMGLKGIAHNHAPNGETHAWPSAHTSSTITLATVMNEYYGPSIGLPLYALSGFVMYERMETGEHWASDVVFGAALGYVVGRTVAARYKTQILGMDVAPYFNPENGSAGLTLMKRF